VGLPWILYAEPGKRQLEAFANGLRYNLTEVGPNCYGIQVRRMDDPRAELRDVASSINEAKERTEAVMPSQVVGPKTEDER
jgi:hypothetical protein